MVLQVTILLIRIEKFLDSVLLPSVTETVKLYVVFEDIPVGVPEITPVDVFKESPDGKAPDVIENVRLEFSGSVANADIGVIDTPSENVPKDPEEYCHTGDWLIYNASGIIPKRFDGFVTLISKGSYAAFSPVKTAVNCTNEL